MPYIQLFDSASSEGEKKLKHSQNTLPMLKRVRKELPVLHCLPQGEGELWKMPVWAREVPRLYWQLQVDARACHPVCSGTGTARY